jgi:hypothetical protein
MRRSSAALVPFTLVLACAMLLPRMVGAQEKPAPDKPAQETPAESGSLAVTIEYTGKGTVDATHRIWIWVFDSPNITAESMPVAVGSLGENGGTQKFSGLPKEVYLAMAFDEKGGYDGSAGPPPPGTPIAIHGSVPGGSAAPVATGGESTVLEASFDDSVRMP